MLKNFNKKIGVILLSLVVAAVLFVVLYKIDVNTSQPYGEKTIFYAIKPITKNTEITKDNVNLYFDKEKSYDRVVIAGAVTSEDDLIGKYVNNDILKNEQISEKTLSSTASRTKNIKNLREIGINFSDISEVVGGTLRTGDTIDLILTVADQNNVKTQTELKNILIDKAITSDGQIISRDNGSKLSATKLTLDLSAEDATKLDNAVKSGTVKAMKVLDDSNYNDITIESNKAQ